MTLYCVLKISYFLPFPKSNGKMPSSREPLLCQFLGRLTILNHCTALFADRRCYVWLVAMEIIPTYIKWVVLWFFFFNHMPTWYALTRRARHTLSYSTSHRESVRADPELKADTAATTESTVSTRCCANTLPDAQQRPGARAGQNLTTKFTFSFCSKT